MLDDLSRECLCLCKSFLASLPFLLMVSLTEGTSVLTESTHSFGQVLLPGEKDSKHATAAAGVAQGGETPLPAPNPYQKFAWFSALGAGKGGWRWYTRLGYFSASSWRVIWKSRQGQWGSSADMRAGGHRMSRPPWSQASVQGWVLPRHCGCAGHLWPANPHRGHAWQQPWSCPGTLPLGTADKGLISSSRDQGIPAVRGLQEHGLWCGQRHLERVEGSYTLGGICAISPQVFPLSLPVPAGLLLHFWLHGQLLCTLWVLCACSANESPIFHLLKSPHLSPSVFAVFKLTKSLTFGMKMYRNINVDPTQLCQTSCNCKGDKFKILYDQWKDFIPAWPSLHLSWHLCPRCLHEANGFPTVKKVISPRTGHC